MEIIITNLKIDKLSLNDCVGNLNIDGKIEIAFTSSGNFSSFLKKNGKLNKRKLSEHIASTIMGKPYSIFKPIKL